MTSAVDELDIRHGTKIGRFVVVGELGAGGMGVVYAAHDRELDRRVALKVLRGASEPGGTTNDERMRMLREGQAMARVTHPNVITVYEVGLEGSLVFLAQELLDGGTLGKWLAAPRTQAEILEKFVAAGRGLGAAHAAGLVHRDFKPDNVLLGTDGRLRVADFGLARSLGEVLSATVGPPRSLAATHPAMNPMSPLTRTGTILGTPMFMAPEQHLGERADERSDQFSFCVALYQALYRANPFEGKTSVALADAVIHGRLERPPRGRGVPAQLRRILVRGLSTDPAARFPSMDALLAELTRPPRRHGRRIAIAAGALAIVGAASAGGYVVITRSSSAPIVPAVREPQKPPPVAAVDGLTAERAAEWLSAALERGQLEGVAEKFDMAGALKLQAGEPPRAAIASAGAAVALVVRGELAAAQARLRDADANKGADPSARAFAELAAAAVDGARGQPQRALDHGRRCAAEFTKSAPVLAALCQQIRGDANASLGDVDSARAAYAEGLAISKGSFALQLAILELDLDAGLDERVATAAAELQTRAVERGASSAQAHARIVVARALAAQGDSQRAFDVLEPVKLDSLEPLRLRLAHQQTLGQIRALLGEIEPGLEQIDAARADAERRGFPELVLRARLARADAQLAVAPQDAPAELAAIAKDARTRGYPGIARLAETLPQR